MNNFKFILPPILTLFLASTVFCAEPTMEFHTELLPITQGTVFSKTDGTVLEVNSSIVGTSQNGMVVSLDYTDEQQELLTLDKREKTIQETLLRITHLLSNKNNLTQKAQLEHDLLSIRDSLNILTDRIAKLNKKIQHSIYTNDTNFISSIFVNKDEVITTGHKLYDYFDLSMGVLHISVNEGTYQYFNDKDVMFVIHNDKNGDNIESDNYTISSVKDPETNEYKLSIFVKKPKHSDIGDTFSITIFEIEI